jgi:hypothetical protein
MGAPGERNASLENGAPLREKSSKQTSGEALGSRAPKTEPSGGGSLLFSFGMPKTTWERGSVGAQERADYASHLSLGG